METNFENTDIHNLENKEIVPEVENKVPLTEDPQVLNTGESEPEQENKQTVEEEKSEATDESPADKILRELEARRNKAKSSQSSDEQKIPNPETQEKMIQEPLSVAQVEPEKKSGEELFSEHIELAEVEIEETDDDTEIHADEHDLSTVSTGQMHDYSHLTKADLIEELKAILENKSVNDIKTEVESIKVHFYKKHNADIQELRKKHDEAMAEAEIPEPFHYEPDPLEATLKHLLKEYRDKKARHNEELEKEKQDNLQRKYAVIDAIKTLIEPSESIDQAFTEFKELQSRWREIGLVPQTESKNLWDNYNFYVERFYDQIKINRELRDLDLKKNLEAKIDLCEKAEELLIDPNIIEAFKKLQTLHASWGETGPVPKEQKEEIWLRFKEATTKINKAYQDHFEKIKLEQENNLKAKTMLCEKAEEIAEGAYAVFKDWAAKSDEILDLQKLWKLIGFAPKKHNNLIYQRFREACDRFFNAKREFFSKIKEEQENNLQLKEDLCVLAESLKDSSEWAKTTDEFIKLRDRWKEIGPVPRKNSDAVWKRFRAACDTFFNRKSEFFTTRDKKEEENLGLKNTLIAEIKAFELTDVPSENLDALKDFQKRWTEIGHVPIKEKDQVIKAYREAINEKFAMLSADEKRTQQARFRQKIDNFQHSGKPGSKVRFEKEKLLQKLQKVESDIVLLENNIGFFAKSKNAEAMIKDIEGKIEKSKEQAQMLREKLAMLDEVEED